jgi:hypothetical protein
MMKQYGEEAHHTWLCTGCMSPVATCSGIDAHIQDRRPADPPLNFISGFGLGVVKQELLEAIGHEAVDRCLLLGRLFGPTGELIRDWVTFRARHQVIVRGSKNVVHRRCEKCGRVIYFAMGQRYLFPSLREDVDLVESDLNGLVIRERIFSRLEPDRWPKLQVEMLPVLSAPVDSLGDLV